jgi:hypothetical protein
MSAVSCVRSVPAGARHRMRTNARWSVHEFGRSGMRDYGFG